MSSRQSFLPIRAAFAISLSVACVAHAQAPRSGGEANPGLMMQLQELTSERTSLLADNERLKKQLDTVTKDRDALKRAEKATDLRAGASAAALAQMTAQRDSSEQQAGQLRAKMSELISQFRETIQTLRDTETERNLTKRTLATRDRELNVCMDRNLALYKLNEDVLNRWDKQSLFGRLASAEPFTRIERTRLENIIDEERGRADDQRLTQERLKAAAAALPSSAPPQVGTPGGSSARGSAPTHGSH